MEYKLRKKDDTSIWDVTEHGLVIADDYAWCESPNRSRTQIRKGRRYYRNGILTKRQVAIREIVIGLLDKYIQKKGMVFMKMKNLSFEENKNYIASATVKYSYGSEIEWETISFKKKEVLPKLRNFTINQIVK